MAQRKLTGPDAGSFKYDLLTALGAAGLHGSSTLQTSVTRLCVLITARYNWRLDEVSIGHLELARLWGVNDRTVKREMKRLISAGMLICKRTGVRGRVGAYQLDYSGIYQLTMPVWPQVGTDFVDRMTAMQGPSRVVRVDFTNRSTMSHVPKGTGTWGAVQQRLRANHPTLFENWFAKLNRVSLNDELLVLEAPNKFVAGYIETHLITKLSDAVIAEIGQRARVKLIISDGH